MAITIEEVRRIAFLARLKLSQEEEKRYARQLSAILDYAARLQEVDTSTIPPTATVLPLRAPMRADVARASTPRDKLLANAAAKKAGMFQVPPVLDHEG